jgi:Phage virion morphogenesis family
MSDGLQFQIGGLDEMLSALDRYADEMVDFRRVEPQLRERFHEMERGQFDTQGARGGTPWPDLSEQYAARKAKDYPGQPVERRTDAVFRSLTGDSPDSISRVDQESFEFGTSVPYAQFQQPEDSGGTYPGLTLRFVVGSGHGTVPARWLIAPTDEDERAFGQIILADAAARARSLGLDAEE